MNYLQPYSCPCGALLGRTGHDRLIVGGVRITETVRVACIACGRVRLWKPLPKCEKIEVEVVV